MEASFTALKRAFFFLERLAFVCGGDLRILPVLKSPHDLG